jgi:hypothetical protein
MTSQKAGRDESCPYKSLETKNTVSDGVHSLSLEAYLTRIASMRCVEISLSVHNVSNSVTCAS